MTKRALLSVYDKRGIVELARQLALLNFEIISSSGTAKVLKEAKIKVTEVSEVTGFPEIMGGRVKTLHPKIHGGILAVRDNKEYIKELQKNKIDPIDLVVVNLYPFETVAKKRANQEELIENIDIGGPAMVRAAAKNFRFTTVVVDPDDYNQIIAELAQGEITLSTRKQLALKAFRSTAFYDAVIASVLGREFDSREKFPPQITLPLRKKSLLRYGENPHQEAALYLFPTARGMDLAQSEVGQGKEMSFNNFLDAEAAINIAAEFDEVVAVVVKHLNPCGVAIGKTQEKAYRTALALDPKSAFGGIVAFNKRLEGSTAKALTETFLEVIIAPDYSKEALRILSTKKNLRVLKIKNFAKKTPGLDYRRIEGGLLVQDKDTKLFKELKVVSKRKPTKRELEDLLFAFKIVKHVKSNAVVVAKNKKTVGIGPGQTSRVDSLEIAIKKAREFKQPLKGSVLASEAFFPFRDSIDQAAKAGIRAVIQPGGSKADEEVIKAVNEYKMAMIFTGMRHFKH